MNKFTALAGTGLLLIGSAAYAQDVPGTPQTHDMPHTTAPMETTPMPDAVAPADSTATDPAMPTDSALPVQTDPMAGAPLPTDSAATGSTTPDPMATGTTTDTAPMAAAEPTAPGSDMAFTDAEIQSFAAAAMKIQNLEGDETAKQEQAAAIVANAGIDPATFNAIGAAMQSDPAVAERVQLAAGGMEAPAQPEG